jgi:hypothetical protein
VTSPSPCKRSSPCDTLTRLYARHRVGDQFITVATGGAGAMRAEEGAPHRKGLAPAGFGDVL